MPDLVNLTVLLLVWAGPTIIAAVGQHTYLTKRCSEVPRRSREAAVAATATLAPILGYVLALGCALLVLLALPTYPLYAGGCSPVVNTCRT